jgi:hypothetical protein
MALQLVVTAMAFVVEIPVGLDLKGHVEFVSLLLK